MRGLEGWTKEGLDTLQRCLPGKCAVCGRPGAQSMRLESGKVIGKACEGECQALLWSEHFARWSGAPRHELDFIAWEWRRRRAEVEGRTFTEPCPKSPAELELDRFRLAVGWMGGDHGL